MLLAGPVSAIIWRTIIASVCALGIWYSLKVARADFLFRQDTASSVRSAIGLAPDDPEYYLRLAQLDESHGQQLIETALRLNQYNAQATIELGVRYETQGDYSRAEKLLVQAFAVDHTYLPRWSLANFYLRRNNLPAFWLWAHHAAEMPADDIRSLFGLCWRVSSDPEQIAATILTNNPETARQYLRFLLEKDRLDAATGVASRLVRDGKPALDGPLLFSVVNQLVAADEPTAAYKLWQELIQQHWVVADRRIPNNAAFARAPLAVSFDWALSSYPGLHSAPGPSGLETEFSGVQPESCSIAEQSLVLLPGEYTLKYTYHTTGIPPGTGIRWEIIDVKSGVVLANSPDLSSDVMKSAILEFSVGQGTSLLRLHLRYQRALGTPRISGTLVILSTEIDARRSV